LVIRANGAGRCQNAKKEGGKCSPDEAKRNPGYYSLVALGEIPVTYFAKGGKGD